MAGPDAGDAYIGGFARFAQCIIPRIEVFPFPELVLKEILLVWHLAIESQKALLVWTQRIEVNLVLLQRIHVFGSRVGEILLD